MISNNAGVDGFGLGMLLSTRQIRKMISSYVGENKEFERQYLAGELELEFNPQGTLAERLRAGGAGIPAFFTRTGYGTIVAEGKETREFDGQHYVMETALHADVSLVKAWKADTAGNLVFRKTARNFNPACAMAGEDLRGRSGAGRGGRRDRSRPRAPARHLRRPHRAQPDAGKAHRAAHRAPRRQVMAWTRDEMAQRAAQELSDGAYVNLGIGLPTLVANHIPDGMDVWLQSENGLLGIGPFPTEDEVDADLINAGKQTVTARARRQLFRQPRFLRDDSRRPHRPGDPGRDAGDRSRRPGQLDGARQDGQGHGRGDGPGRRRQARGRADGARREGRRAQDPAAMHLPLTGVGVVNRIITELAVFDVTADGLRLVEAAPGVSDEELREKTGCRSASGCNRGNICAA